MLHFIQMYLTPADNIFIPKFLAAPKRECISKAADFERIALADIL